MFKSQASQIGHRVANGSPPLRHFFKNRYIQLGRYASKNEPCKFVTRFDVITPEYSNGRFDKTENLLSIWRVISLTSNPNNVKIFIQKMLTLISQNFFMPT